MNLLQQTEIERFLDCGEYDNSFAVWSGGTFVDKANSGSHALRNALIVEVETRAGQVAVPAHHQPVPAIDACVKFTPMVHGLFPSSERQIVLDLLERSVIFLTPVTIKDVLEKMPWLPAAWDLANIYLASLDAKPFGDTALELVGLSAGTTCYVSMNYFSNRNPFDDYVVHEAAHIFHNCKRESIGLAASRRREWMLEIDFQKRETFAYSCEAYSRLLELGKTRSARAELLSELAEGLIPADERVDGSEYVDILREAVAARNGWKRILERCSSP